MRTSLGTIVLTLACHLTGCSKPSPPPPCRIDPWPYLNWLAQNTRPDPNRTIRYIAHWDGLRNADRVVIPESGAQETLAFLVEVEPSLEDRIWVVVTLAPQDASPVRVPSRSHLVRRTEDGIVWLMSFDY